MDEVIPMANSNPGPIDPSIKNGEHPPRQRPAKPVPIRDLVHPSLNDPLKNQQQVTFRLIKAGKPSNSTFFRIGNYKNSGNGSLNNYVAKILPFFDHLPNSTWTFETMSVVKNEYFWTTYPPHLFHVVIERPLRLGVGRLKFGSNWPKYKKWGTSAQAETCQTSAFSWPCTSVAQWPIEKSTASHF